MIRSVNVDVGVTAFQDSLQIRKTPAVMPWAGTDRTSAAVIVPVTVPPAVGQAGLPPPPQRNTKTAPATPGSAKWIWDIVTLLDKPEKVSV